MTERRRSSNASWVPPTEPVKSVSPVKTACAVDDEREHPARVPGRPQRLDAKVARLDDLAVAERLGALDLLLGRGEHAQPEPLLEQLVVGHVIGVRVRRQQERGVHLEPLDSGEQRLDGRAGIDEDGGPAGPGPRRGRRSRATGGPCSARRSWGGKHASGGLLRVAANGEVEVEQRERDGRRSGSTSAKRSVAKKLMVASGASVTKMTRMPVIGPVTASMSRSTNVIAATLHQCPRTRLRLPRERLAAAAALERRRPAGRTPSPPPSSPRRGGRSPSAARRTTTTSAAETERDEAPELPAQAAEHSAEACVSAPVELPHDEHRRGAHEDGRERVGEAADEQGDEPLDLVVPERVEGAAQAGRVEEGQLRRQPPGRRAERRRARSGASTRSSSQ